MSARADLEYEIFVVNNSSGDHTAQMLSELAGVLGPRLKVISLPMNRDITYSRNRALKQAAGRMVCMINSDAELFDHLGPLDERIFYAPEDVDWCLRCWKAGRAVIYYPRFKVLHHTRQTTHKHPLSPTALSHLKGLL